MASADNNTNATVITNPLDCPTFRCSQISGTVANISFHQPWSVNAGNAFCSAQAVQTASYDTSYWVQTCTYPLNATDAQKDLVTVPSGILRECEGMGDIKADLSHYKTESSVVTIVAIVTSLIASGLAFYVFYVEYWVPAHEE